jgi:hypothetical protein
MHRLLVIDGSPANNWYRLFKNVTAPDGQPLQVEQTQWDLIEAWHDSESLHVQISPSPEPILGTSQKYERSMVPDFMLVRNFVLGIHGQNWINTLMALRIGNVESVNSLNSIFFSTQRAMMIAEMRRVQAKLKSHNVEFPIIPIKYFPNTRQHIVCDSYPMVCKVGTSHAGYGKMRFKRSNFSDFSTLLAMYNDYVTVEPFVPNVGDIRIQKIGQHIRAYKRTVVKGWKGNVGESRVEDIAVTDTYKIWAEECSHIFGGLDILSIDAVIDEKGNHTILEVNDTATGLNPVHAEEDSGHIRDLVIQRMEEAYRSEI